MIKYDVNPHPWEPRGNILSLVLHYQKKYPWERSLLELVPEVEIQNGDIQIINVLSSYTSFWLVDLRGSTNQERFEFGLLEQAPTDSVPRGISSGSEEQRQNFTPGFPRMGKPKSQCPFCFPKNLPNIFSFNIFNGNIRIDLFHKTTILV